VGGRDSVPRSPLHRLAPQAGEDLVSQSSATGEPAQAKEGAQRVSLAIIGIGSVLAGDDGVGVAVIERLRRRVGEAVPVLLHTVEGDLLEIADWLPRAQHFIFVDAIAGDLPGRIVIGWGGERAWAPSFHQTDLPTTLDILNTMQVCDPFPTWEIWGVTIAPPREARLGLTPDVEVAADQLVERLQSAVKAVQEA
jgi:hydrogenase maturation protease